LGTSDLAAAGPLWHDAAMLAHRVRPDEKLRLADLDPDDRCGFSGKEDPDYQKQMESLAKRLNELQEKLYAEQKQALLVVLQAMDTGGKDGVLRVVVGPLDSRGVHVVSYKAPSSEELAHDFLWRCHMKVPKKGEITFFNRSHYEDVLVVRVLNLVDKAVWKDRYQLINDWERMLEHGGTRVVKIFLNISRDEQKKRLEERLVDQTKHWKFEPADLDMRARWDDFMHAYEDALSRCSTEAAPWFVVPANRKWVRNIAVAEILVRTLEDMKPDYPHVHWDASKIKIPD
jgi:PPK2 family polyphosphate:nucleotide phosphotransferase